jgi:hypothetical protein
VTRSWRVGTFGLALVLAGCGAATPAPPTILRAGIASEVNTDGSSVEIRFASGPPARLSLAGLRLVTGGVGGELVVLGSDAAGPFLAGFTTQDGLPSSCYVENARGIDRGGFIELRGILWQKSAAIDDPVRPGSGRAYPSGTRFCFDETAAIWAVVPPTDGQIAPPPNPPPTAAAPAPSDRR